MQPPLTDTFEIAVISQTARVTLVPIQETAAPRSGVQGSSAARPQLPHPECSCGAPEPESLRWLTTVTKAVEFSSAD